MKGRIFKLDDRLGFIEYDIDKRTSFYNNKEYDFLIGDLVEFNLGFKSIPNTTTQYEIAADLVLLERQRVKADKETRLSKVSRNYNLGLKSITDILRIYGFDVPTKPNAKINEEQILILKEHLINQANVEDISPESVDRGIVIKSTVQDIIYPSTVVMQFFGGKKAILTSNNLSWNKSRSEKIIRSLKKGDEFEVVVLENENDTFPIISKKHLLARPSETSLWEELELGDLVEGRVFEKLISEVVVELENGFFGLVKLKDDRVANLDEQLTFKVDWKNHISQYIGLSFAEKKPKPQVVGTIKSEPKEISVDSKYEAHETDLRNLDSFRNSIYHTFCDEEQEEFIIQSFENNPTLFSSAISIDRDLYIQFGLNLPAWESDFKNKLIPYLSDNKDRIEESKALEYLSKQKYWIRINRFIVDENTDRRKYLKGIGNSPLQKVEWSLFNEEISIQGFVDLDSYSFVIKGLAIRRRKKNDSRRKSINLANGTFLYDSELVFLSPFDNKPQDNKQSSVFNALDNKTRAFEIILSLKKETGALLLEEGQSLQIFDRFLEYQEDILKKGNNANKVWINSQISRKPSAIGELSIHVNENLDEFCSDDEGGTVVTLKTLESSTKEGKDEEFVYFSDAFLEVKEGQIGSQLHFKDGDLELGKLNQGFQVEPKVSLRQFQVQREVIQDFFSKKIKLQHIEALLLKPEKISPPEISSLNFYNEMLNLTESSNPNNNQVNSVKKSVGNKNIFLVQGPPGTGKTTVIAEIVKQLSDRGEKLLVTSQTHIAVDNVLEKLAEDSQLSLLRLGNIQRVKSDLRRFHKDKLKELYQDYFDDMIKINIDLATLYKNKKGLVSQEELIDRAESLQTYPEAIKLELFKYNLNFINALLTIESDKVEALQIALDNWLQNISSETNTIIKPLIFSSLDVVFATCIGVRTDRDLTDYDVKFDTVIIDEAGKANLSESIAAMSIAKKVILVGDQMQLPPYIDGSLLDPSEKNSFPNTKYGSKFLEVDIQHALRTSFFEFLVKRIENNMFPDSNIEMLNYQHRMHPHIGQFISDAFYDGLVKMGERTIDNVLPMPSPFDKQVVFLDTSTAENPFEIKQGISVKNDAEAQCIAQLVVPKLLSSGLTHKDFAIVAPYKSQVANIKSYLQGSRSGMNNQIEVSTLDSFQGMEFDVIVFSFTRSDSNSKVGFLDDARRLNVAFSRAKKKLILIGNSETLTDKRSHYDQLYNYTGLFQKLVRLSKNDSIGNFVNVTDFTDLKTKFQSLIGQFTTGNSYKCRLKLTFEKPEYAGHIFFIGETTLEGMFRDDSKSFEFDNEIQYEMQINYIDHKNEKVFLSPAPNEESMDNFFSSHKVGDKISVEFLKSIKTGHLFQIEKGFTCYYHDIDKTKSFNSTTVVELFITGLKKEDRKVYVSDTPRGNQQYQNKPRKKRFQKDETQLLKFFHEHKRGDEFEGIYTNSIDFGHFFQLKEGVSGLVRDPQKRITNLQRGETYQVFITNMDTGKKQITLKLKKRSHGNI
jgi:superfamily I DNA and/or RNA helicase